MTNNKPINDFLGKSEVSYLDMSLSIEEQVFWLKVSVHYVEGVEVIKGGYNL